MKKVFISIGIFLAILYLANYAFYIFHWFADIFSGKCYWWSLGFICHG